MNTAVPDRHQRGTTSLGVLPVHKTASFLGSEMDNNTAKSKSLNSRKRHEELTYMASYLLAVLAEDTKPSSLLCLFPIPSLSAEKNVSNVIDELATKRATNAIPESLAGRCQKLFSK